MNPNKRFSVRYSVRDWKLKWNVVLRQITVVYWTSTWSCLLASNISYLRPLLVNHLSFDVKRSHFVISNDTLHRQLSGARPGRQCWLVLADVAISQVRRFTIGRWTPVHGHGRLDWFDDRHRIAVWHFIIWHNCPVDRFPSFFAAGNGSDFRVMVPHHIRRVCLAIVAVALFGRSDDWCGLRLHAAVRGGNEFGLVSHVIWWCLKMW